jgi:hypothetical protein
MNKNSKFIDITGTVIVVLIASILFFLGCAGVVFSFKLLLKVMAS